MAGYSETETLDAACRRMNTKSNWDKATSKHWILIETQALIQFLLSQKITRNFYTMLHKIIAPLRMIPYGSPVLTG